MKELLDFLGEIQKSSGIWGVTITVIVMILAFISYRVFKNDILSEKVINWFIRKRGKITTDSLKKHSIFKKSATFRYKASKLTFEGEYYKTKIFRSLIDTKIVSDIHMLKFFMAGDIGKMNRYKLQEKMYQTVELLAEKFDEVFKLRLHNLLKEEITVFRKDYTVKEMEILIENMYDYIMYKKGGFEYKRKERIERIMTDIEEIPDNIIYNDNFERVHRFLDILMHNIDSMINSAYKDFKYFNGDVDNKINNFINKSKDNKVEDPELKKERLRLMNEQNNKTNEI